MLDFDGLYQIIPLGPEYGPEVAEFLMSHFLLEEPLNRATRMSRASFKPFVEKLLERTLGVPFSYAIIERQSNDIVACAMSSLWENKPSEEHVGDEFVFDAEKNASIEAVGKILTGLHAKLFELRPELQRVLHLEILSVAKHHQRRGLASRLMNKMEDKQEMDEFQVSGIASEISSLANQCLMKKRGYTTIAETLLSSECDESGKPLIRPDDGTDRVILVHKQF